MAIINILIAVDTATLTQQVKDGSIMPGTQSSPTSLSSYSRSDVYIAMVTQSGNASSNTQVQSELEINCKHGDIIQWAIMSFANNIDQSVYLYDVESDSKFKKIKFCSSHIKNYLPAPGNGASIGTVTEYTNQIAFVRTAVAKQFLLMFQLINNSDGTVIGYFSWDTIVNIK